MTTKKQELTLFGGWAKVQQVTLTDDGVSRDSVVVSLSISRLELRLPLPPKFGRHHRPLFGGAVQVQRLALTEVEIADEGHKLSLEVQDSPLVWERAYQAIGKTLWRKLETFSTRAIAASQPELWQDEEEADQEEEIKVSVEVSPLLHSTDQVRMLWITRLELRKRLRAFHWPRRQTFNPHSEVIQEFLYHLM
jgi:hypothetical protein